MWFKSQDLPFNGENVGLILLIPLPRTGHSPNLKIKTEKVFSPIYGQTFAKSTIVQMYKDKKSSTAEQYRETMKNILKNIYGISWKPYDFTNFKGKQSLYFRMKLSKSATVQMYEDKKSSTTEQYRESAQAVCMCMRGAHSKVFQMFSFLPQNIKSSQICNFCKTGGPPLIGDYH